MRFLVGGLMLAAACGGGGMDPPPSDAASSSDAATSTGLTVAWLAAPPIPSTIKSDLDVATATFRLARLQVIGDGAAGSTTATDLELAWPGLGPGPAEIRFEAAPAGLYSKVTLDVDSASALPVVELTGTTRIAGVVEPFRIYDTEGFELEVIGFDVDLPPGGNARVVIKLDLKDTLEAVDYAALPVVNGVRTLDPSDAQIDEVRDKLGDAFTSR